MESPKILHWVFMWILRSSEDPGLSFSTSEQDPDTLGTGLLAELLTDIIEAAGLWLPEIKLKLLELFENL